MPTLKRLQFIDVIAAPPARVWRTMLEQDTYRDWTSEFTTGSYYEGTIEKGNEIRFLSPSRDGMIADIAELRRNEFLSIRHLGIIHGGVEDRDSAEVKSWAPAYENYTFETVPGGTHLVVDLDVAPSWESMMAEMWPRALARLKTICEQKA